MTTFWLVWSPRGNSPKKKHPTREIATAEARRLSERLNGRHFYVLECVDVAIVGPEIPTPGQVARAKATAAVDRFSASAQRLDALSKGEAP